MSYRPGHLRRFIRPGVAVLAALLLSGCIIAPRDYGRPHYHPYYWYR